MTTDRDPRGEQPSGVSVVTALTVGWVSFAALAILGFGMLSYFADVDITRGGEAYRWGFIVGMVLTILGFAGVLGRVLLSPRPSYWSALLAGLAAAVVQLFTVGLAAVFAGLGVGTALGVMYLLVIEGVSLVTLLTGAIAAWIAIALRRTRSGRPHWPWEDENDPE